MQVVHVQEIARKAKNVQSSVNGVNGLSHLNVMALVEDAELCSSLELVRHQIAPASEFSVCY